MMSIAAARAAAAYAPPYRSSVALWLDLTSPDTSIVSGAVAVLGDRSGYARHHSQGTGTRRLTYTASDANFGGRPSMAADGVDDALNYATLWGALPGYTIVTALRHTATRAATMEIWRHGTGGSQAGAAQIFRDVSSLTTSGRFTSPAGSFTTRGHAGALSTTYTYVLALDPPAGGAGSTPGFYANGANQGLTASLAVATATTGTYASTLAAATAAGVNPAPVTIGPDWIVYNRALSADEAAVARAWLVARYGL